MIFTDYYKGEMLTDAGSRFDITFSTESYEYFENLFINKKKCNIGGQSFNYVNRPEKWKGEHGRIAAKAITKGNVNVSSVFVPNIKEHLIGYGDINNTKDALIILFNANYTVIELFIARGYINDIQALYTYIKEGEFNAEMQALRDKAIYVFKGDKPKLPNK